jgi:hypothetical protein
VYLEDQAAEVQFLLPQEQELQGKDLQVHRVAQALAQAVAAQVK